MRRSHAFAHLIAENATQFRIMSAKAFRKPVPCSAREWSHMWILAKFDKLQMTERRQSIPKELRCQSHWSFFTVDVTSFLTYEFLKWENGGQRNSGYLFIDKWHAEYPTSCHSVSKIWGWRFTFSLRLFIYGVKPIYGIAYSWIYPRLGLNLRVYRSYTHSIWS